MLNIRVLAHVPSKQLSVRFADDVLREYEHSGKCWGNQKTVTVKFKYEFDEDFQRTLKEYCSCKCAKGARDHRLRFYATHPPVEHIFLYQKRERSILPVPADQKQAEEMLAELYDRGQDKNDKPILWQVPRESSVLRMRS